MAQERFLKKINLPIKYEMPGKTLCGCAEWKRTAASSSVSFETKSIPKGLFENLPGWRLPGTEQLLPVTGLV